jgi:ribosomal protein S6--L-glutamate ligase
MKANKTLIGRKEWCALPSLGIHKIRAKIDTGAKTSALHAENIQFLKNQGVDCVTFALTPFADEEDDDSFCVCPITDIRNITSSNGKKEVRYVIRADFSMGNIQKNIELTLTNRHLMRYNLLLGREALTPHFVVDPSKAYLLKKPRKPAS